MKCATGTTVQLNRARVLNAVRKVRDDRVQELEERREHFIRHNSVTHYRYGFLWLKRAPYPDKRVRDFAKANFSEWEKSQLTNHHVRINQCIDMIALLEASQTEYADIGLDDFAMIKRYY